MSLKISIVDNDTRISRVLSELVDGVEDIEIVSIYNDSGRAISKLPEDAPDVVLMDINMPGANGIECVHRLKKILPKTQFLMLTVYADTEYIFSALKAGATGYLLKGTSRDQLMDAIRQIAAGGSPMTCSIARKVVHSFVEEENDDGLEMLSPRERVVLDLLAKGYIYKEIAQSMEVTYSTVHTYVRRIYEKLQVNSRSKAIAKYLGS